MPHDVLAHLGPYLEPLMIGVWMIPGSVQDGGLPASPPRTSDIERDKMTLWLKTTKSTPDDEAYDLDLKEDELDGLWEAAVDWIQENKNSKAPHLYMTVELGSG